MVERPHTQSPVSDRLQVKHLPQKGVTVTLEADDAQRAALARAHDLVSVERFFATLAVRPWRGEGVRVSGKVEADVTQLCVVTMEPIPAQIDEDVEALFVPEGSRLSRADHEGGEIVLEPEGGDVPEPFAGDRVDVGALAEEFFALGIDPYPRKENAALEVPDEPEDKEAGPLHEGLKRLRRKG